MLGILIVAAAISGIMAYLVGYAFVAPRESFLRSKAGGMVLAACVLTALLLPPGLEKASAIDVMPSWPLSLDPGFYRFTWIALMVLGLFCGLRVWRMRRLSLGFTLDESPVGRAEGQLPLADSLAAALDVLSRERLTQRDVARLAPTLRLLGSRFWYQLPEKDSKVYNLVAQHVEPAVAADVTGLLLKGAARKEGGR